MQQVGPAEEGHVLDLSADAEVEAILADHLPGGVQDITAAALARGRAKVILRDAANDDDAPEAQAVSA